MPAIQPFQLGDIEIDPPLLLAPMAGHTNVAFRTLVREMGACGLVCSELISSHVLNSNPKSRKTRQLFDWSPAEWPFAVQLFGSDPEEMARAAQIVVRAGAPVGDINMGCWVPKVAKKGYGAALLSDLPRARAVVEAVVEAVDAPVTVKVRIGFEEGNPTAVEFARAAAEVGAGLVTVHGRYAKQGFKGESDHSVTARVKEAVGGSMMVVANGDIVDSRSALRVFEETGCDGLMLGREALRRPWIIADIARRLCGKALNLSAYKPTEIALRQLQLARELIDKPERVLVRELRGQLLPYRLGAPPDHRCAERTALESQIREGLVKAETFQQLEETLLRADALCKRVFG